MRMKVYCNYKQEVQGGVHLYFSPVVDGSDENKRFFAATPGGNILVYTVNKAASDNFEQGKQYYVDFSPAERSV